MIITGNAVLIQWQIFVNRCSLASSEYLRLCNYVFFKHYSLVKLCGGVLFFSLRQLSNRPRWLTLKNTLNLTINQVCLSWHGVILAGLQMCRRWVGLAYFPLSKNQRLMATSQGSAAGSVCRVHLSSLCSLIRCVCINSLPSSDTLQGC